MLTKEIELKIKEIIMPILECVEGVELYGSYANPYVRVNRDYDIIIIVIDEEKKHKVIDYFIRTYNHDEFIGKGMDIHFRTKKEIVNLLYKRPIGYQYKFSIPILDYEKCILDIDILDKNNEEKIKKSIIGLLRWCREKQDGVYKNKYWYHAYTTMCILKHNSYDLSEEEIANINILHDKKEEDIEKRKQLIDEMIKEIESWQI